VTDYTLPPLPAESPHVCTGDALRCFDGHGCECEMAGNPPPQARYTAGQMAAYAEAARAPLLARLREACQTLVAAVGADGPCSAEDAAARAVARIAELEAELDACIDRLAADAAGGALAERAPAGEPVAVYLVPTGETRNGHELYERHDSLPPLCDAERLYAAAPPSQPVALPDEMPVPDPHAADDDCNCEQVGHARGWNACRRAMIAAAPVGKGVRDA
jgi:hypothetical protein